MKLNQLIPAALSLALAMPAFAANPDPTLADIERTFGFVPTWMDAYPKEQLPAAWEEMKAIWVNPDTAVPPKYKDLISLAVAAQIPCEYCTLADAEFARLNGASEVEIKK